jgi:hypothetical protein
MSLLSWLLVILAGLSLATMVVSLNIANRAAREARSTIFPIVREEEMTRARHARIATSLTGVIALMMAGAFFLSGQLPAPAFPSQQRPTQAIAVAPSPVPATAIPATPTEIPSPPTEVQAASTSSQVRLVATFTLPAASATSVPPATSAPRLATSTSAPAPSATRRPVPQTPTPTAPPATAPVSAQMGPIIFSTRITDDRQPVSPTSDFSDSIDRVYATFPYSGMQNGLNWTQVWYYNGAEYSRGENRWDWGNADQSYIFTRLVGAGTYRLELYVNDDLLASAEFTVQGPIAIGGPQTTETPEIQVSSQNPESEGSPATLGGPASQESQVTPEIQASPQNPESEGSPATPENPASQESPATPENP